jgi:hypothetical protein
MASPDVAFRFAPETECEIRAVQHNWHQAETKIPLDKTDVDATGAKPGVRARIWMGWNKPGVFGAAGQARPM